MNVAEAAYIAGLFDGEGCVTCKQRPTKRHDKGGKIYNQWHIRCEISMTEKDIIAWLHETLGFGWSAEKKYSKRPAHYKRQWRWCCGYRDALQFAKLIWPYAQVKLHKIEQIIDHYEPRAQELGDNVVDLETEREIRRT
tara:strand:- start:301 stop:717 length:417 start_codon:yes stop_codon:yes gene_type:complete